ncbi:amino acid adenylation domain-containing protein [Actinosynnema mirum]|uniref:Phenyloxazoline synthase MbtB n=1 Tax=Actinosynnema mirum (strain ATCC 29888 / DSM 43827 / JCM 3225 / NBRC 14064 / NCIMB 13271 / NRRL B-12336 / IMRU 3971 / 101) TaxID=446462 RepID=C6WBZ2_ACTMD|nr:non-ribosomal peptide synthetase [Actinosynnema mirum]ACU37559.1 amino acid adenylation domain protein [Actinosynnema mirum DSM 43827]
MAELDRDRVLLGASTAEEVELRRRIAALPPERRALFEEALSAGLAESGPPGRPAVAGGPVRPSFGQERMWVLSRLTPVAYNYATAVRLRGRFNPVALRAAVDAVARRQESLRTSLVHAGDGGLVCSVAERVAVPLRIVDLGPAGDDGLLERLVTAEIGSPFDLAQGPLLRSAVFRLGPDDHLVLLTAHHVITDGWSNGVLAQDLSQGYRDLVAGHPVRLPMPELGYRDFAAWQRNRAEGPQSRELTDFWRERLVDLPHTELPLDRPRPATGRGAGANHSLVLGPDLAAGLERLRRENGGSLLVLVLTALAVVLRAMTGQGDLALGTLVSGRSRPEFQRLVGYFVNVVLLRLSAPEGASFRATWAGVREAVRESLAHQELPYEKLLELHRESGRSGNPIRVLCVAQQARPSLELPGLDVEQLEVEPGAAQYDLLVEVGEDASGVRISCQYDVDLFTGATVRQLAEHLRTVLVGAVQGADRTGAELLAEPSGRAAPTAAPPAAESVSALFEQQARRTPDAVALHDGPHAVTYRALDRRANQLADLLAERGVAPGDRVACCLPRSTHSVLAALAVLKLGAAYVAVDPRQPAERIGGILADARSRCALTTAEFSGVAAVADVPLVVLDEVGGELAGRSAHWRSRPVHHDSVAYLVYTSGSTGAPKGVLGTHRGLVNRIRWTQRAYPTGDAEVWAARTSPGFVDAVWEIFGPLLSGVPLVLVGAADTADPARLVEVLATWRVTRLVAVPTLLRIMLEDRPDLERDLPLLLTWVSSGEALTTELAERFHRGLPGRRLLNLYGSAEVAADATAFEVAPGCANHPAVPIGAPLDGVDVEVLTPSGVPAPPLGVGELHVGGAGLALGYHCRPAETAARFLPAPGADRAGRRRFRTGDQVRRRVEGGLDYLGRLDSQVQIRGHRVEPGEVEGVLREHPRVREAAVTARADAIGDLSLVAYVVTADDTGQADDLTAFLRRRLPPYAVPSAVVRLPELPLNASGKVDRPRLPHPGPERDRPAPVRPGTPLEAAVLDVFEDVLPVAARPRASDDFFLLGGHSLLAAHVAALLRERLGVEVSLGDLLAAPTAVGLATRLEHAAAPPEARTASGPAARIAPDPAAAHEPFPLTEVQRAYLVGRDAEFDLGEVATHAYLELNAAGLDIDRFETALNEVIGRHPMLRAVMSHDGTQRVLESVPRYLVAHQDLSRDDSSARRRRLLRWREELSHQVLPADRWPLFDVRVSRLPGRDAVVHISVDALICDAYSFGLVMTELADRYAGRGGAHPPLGLTFRDYVLAQERRRREPAHEKALAYWRDRLAELPAGPELPMATSPEHVDRPRFARRSGRLEKSDWSALKARAAERGLTASALLLNAFVEVVTRWSRRPHYSLVLTVFQRESAHPEVGGLVGDFTSLSVLEVDRRTRSTFAEHAHALQRRLWDDLDHAQVSGVEVMRWWNRERGLPPGALTPVVFTSNLPVGGAPRPEAADSPFGEVGFAITQTPQVHLDHQVGEQGGALVFNWDSVDELFSPGVVDGMFDEYRRLLGALVEDESGWTAPLEAALPAAQAATRAGVTVESDAAPPRCLHEAVLAAAERLPDHVAVVDGLTRTTYRDLVARAHRVARTLLARPGPRQTLVGIAIRKSWQQVAAALGVVEAGMAFLPLDVDLPPARLRHLVERGELRTVLTAGEDARRLPLPPDVLVVDLDDDAALDPSTAPPLVPVDPADLAYVIFTSGSTGTPKGVMIDHRGAANTVDAVNGRFGIGPEDRVLAVSSLSFDLAVYDLFGLLAAGGTVVLPEHGKRRDPAHWSDLVRRERITVWNSVPALAGVLADHVELLAPDALASLRLVMLSGDWIPIALPDRVRALAGRATVLSLGGATEGSIWSVWYPIGEVDPAWPSVPYGVAMPGQSARVLDEDLRPRPDWVVGELFLGGQGVALGYWRDREQTDHRFPTDPDTGGRLYRTGDLARHLPDGNLEFLGREDGQVKVNGYRVELGEVETAVQRLPGVQAAAVVAAGEPGADRRLVAFYVPEPGFEPDPVGLRPRLGEALPGYLVPALFRPLDRIPLTPNGKVDRSALQERVADRGRPAPAARPATPARGTRLHEGIGAIWAELLSVPEVRPQDDFFALGGTSLQAIRLVAKVREQLGLRIRLNQLFENPTPAALADAVTGAQSGEGPEPGALPALAPSPGDRYEPFPLTDIQHAYWLGRRAGLGLGGVATHGYVEMDVDDLDLGRLERALRVLVDRHDALRTVVRRDGTQQVLKTVPGYRIETADLRAQPSEAAAERLAEVRAEMSHQVRDAGSWPLFELRAHRLDDLVTRLHLSIDLLIADAHSSRILTGELMAAYQDPAATLPEPACTFRDYVVAVAELKRGSQHRQALDYWTGRLAELPPAPGLPLARRPEELTAPRFHRVHAELPQDRWRAVRDWAASTGLTPSAVLCTAFSEVLARWSDSPRFTVNVTTFNRLPLHPDVDSLVGDFTTTTLLAVDGARGATFAARARHLQERLWQDLEHRLVSGVDVLRMLRRRPDRRDEAMMPVVFTSTLLPGDALPGAGAPAWRARTVHAVSQTPQVLLDCQVGEQDGTLLCAWDFVAEAFPPGLVESMFDAFTTVLDALVETAVRTGGDLE